MAFCYKHQLSQESWIALQSLSDAPKHSWLEQGQRGKKDFLLFQPCFSQVFSAVKFHQLQVLCLEQSVKYSSSQPQGLSTPSPGAASLRLRKDFSWFLCHKSSIYFHLEFKLIRCCNCKSLESCIKVQTAVPQAFQTEWVIDNRLYIPIIPHSE